MLPAALFLSRQHLPSPPLLDQISGLTPSPLLLAIALPHRFRSSRPLGRLGDELGFSCSGRVLVLTCPWIVVRLASYAGYRAGNRLNWSLSYNCHCCCVPHSTLQSDLFMVHNPRPPTTRDTAALLPHHLLKILASGLTLSPRVAFRCANSVNAADRALQRPGSTGTGS